ncbi:hypothetical protein HA466_0012470 [Hirschfeldia incana]|nr:hypothetical protein HA466_0012470 [Hirschfeldia incana]
MLLSGDENNVVNVLCDVISSHSRGKYRGTDLAAQDNGAVELSSVTALVYDAHHSFIDGREIIVDYNRQQLMHGWRIPRRLDECHSLILL